VHRREEEAMKPTIMVREISSRARAVTLYEAARKVFPLGEAPDRVVDYINDKVWILWMPRHILKPDSALCTIWFRDDSSNDTAVQILRHLEEKDALDQVTITASLVGLTFQYPGNKFPLDALEAATAM
jgi:hypothetical protein